MFIHARQAMLSVPRFVIPKALNKQGVNCGDEVLQFKVNSKLKYHTVNFINALFFMTLTKGFKHGYKYLYHM